MTRRNAFSLFLATLLVLTGSVVATSGSTGDDATLVAPPIGATVEDFKLPDADGKEHSLNSLKGKNGAVLIFISVQCPVSNAYNERMDKLAQDFNARGITVIGVNANNTEPADAVKAHASAQHLTFTILKDPGNKLADRLGATKTPEAYLVDANNRLVYHGRVDNSKDPAGVESSELRDAMDALLAGKPIQKTTATAFGCTIKRS
jgi:peroxiredoxin